MHQFIITNETIVEQRMSRDSNAKEKHIGGREATNMAIENGKRRPIVLDPAPVGSVGSAADAQSLLKQKSISRLKLRLPAGKPLHVF